MARSASQLKQSVTTTTPKPKRLSLEEEKELIHQVLEYRRLSNLEREISIQNDNTLPLLSLRSKAAGYGSELQLYQDALENGQRAREMLVTRNMGLVHYCVSDILKTKRLNSLSREDLVQEGAIGLARAVDKYNPATGARLGTYAVYWIRAAVLRAVAERDDLLRVPSHVSDAIRKATRAAKRMGLDDDYAESSHAWKEAHAAKALAVEAGLTDRQLEQAMRVRSRRNAGGYTRLEPWMQKGTKQQQQQQDEEEEVSPDVEQLKSILSRYLRPKEMEALSWRYGLKRIEKEPRDYLAETEQELYGAVTTKGGKWGEAMSFTEVGKHMKVSAEYGRRLCHKALDKLRAAAEEGTLEPALLY